MLFLREGSTVVEYQCLRTRTLTVQVPKELIRSVIAALDWKRCILVSELGYIFNGPLDIVSNLDKD